MTPEARLFRAVKRGDFKAASAAIAEGADISLVRINDKSLLRMAGELGLRNICELLVKAGANSNETNGVRQYSLLHNAAASFNYGFACILLDLKAYPSPKASNNSTPLHFAARSGQQFLVDKLLEHGAELDAQDNQGRSPLYCAVQKGDSGMVKFLIRRGSDVNLTDCRGRSPLAIAEAAQMDDIESLLLKNGATQRSATTHAQRLNRAPENLGLNPNER